MGRKIEAIKEYRALHRVDLKSAKDAIEARARELGR
jgi:ribosomal protein L7/L12